MYRDGPLQAFLHRNQGRRFADCGGVEGTCVHQFALLVEGQNDWPLLSFDHMHGAKHGLRSQTEVVAKAVHRFVVWPGCRGASRSAGIHRTAPRAITVGSTDTAAACVRGKSIRLTRIARHDFARFVFGGVATPAAASPRATDSTSALVRLVALNAHLEWK